MQTVQQLDFEPLRKFNDAIFRCCVSKYKFRLHFVAFGALVAVCEVKIVTLVHLIALDNA